MTTLRRLSWATLVLAFGHIVFGAIVRISGSGMGCGENWPRCHGYWFPPLSRPDLIIEVSHRYFAATLTVAILACVLLAWSKRGERGVGGVGGVLRPLLLAAALVVIAALFGAVTVFLALANKAVIVTHLAIAMSLLGALVVAVVRAGGPPRIPVYDNAAASPSPFQRPPQVSIAASAWQTSGATLRGTYVAAALGFLALILGALTAHVPGANSACTGFPLCTGGILPTDPAQHLQFTHRLVAFALFFHLVGISVTTRRRREPEMARLALLAVSLTFAQILVAAAMVELSLPAVWRSLHEAVGTLTWIAICFMTYGAQRSALPGVRATDRRESAAPLPGGIRA